MREINLFAQLIAGLFDEPVPFVIILSLISIFYMQYKSKKIFMKEKIIKCADFIKKSLNQFIKVCEKKVKEETDKTKAAAK